MCSRKNDILNKLRKINPPVYFDDAQSIDNILLMNERLEKFHKDCIRKSILSETSGSKVILD